MWQRFTERARKVVFYAQEEAQRFGEGYVSTEHLLLGLVREPDSCASKMLDEMGVELDRIRREIEKQLPRGDARPSQDMTLTPRAKRVIDLAYDEARKFEHNYIGTEHLLLGLIREGDGLAARVLKHLKVDLDQSRQSVARLTSSEWDESRAGPRSAMETMRDWAKKAAGALHPNDRNVGALGDAAAFMLLNQGRFVLDHIFLGLLATMDPFIGATLEQMKVDRLGLMTAISMRMLEVAGEAIDGAETHIGDTFVAANEIAKAEEMPVFPIHLAIAILEKSGGIAANKIDPTAFRAAWDAVRNRK